MDSSIFGAQNPLSSDSHLVFTADRASIDVGVLFGGQAIGDTFTIEAWSLKAQVVSASKDSTKYPTTISEGWHGGVVAKWGYVFGATAPGGATQVYSYMRVLCPQEFPARRTMSFASTQN